MEPTKFDVQFSAVRRAVIEQVFERMNDMQRKAVFHTEGPLLILAGAGSGKTTVLIHRMINIIRFGQAYDHPYAPAGATMDDFAFLAGYLADPKPEDEPRAVRLCSVSPARPWEVMAITFTNKAARELRERLERAIGEEDASAVWAHTFHTACLRILRSNIERLGYEKSFTIYDEDDKKRVIRAILKDLDLDEKVFDPRQVINMISRAKDILQTPEMFAAQSGGEFFRGKIAEVYKRYEKMMQEANALDFDDIIMKTVQLLQNHDDVRTYYQNKFRYVMVDEYQDTNHAQYVLISLLAGGYQNICVVGDDDQSIYKFRGATITNILEFEKQFRNAEIIRLEQNYRSTDVILNAANAVIRNNQYRKGKELWTDRKNGEKIRLHRAHNQDAEAEYIARIIREQIAEGHRYSDFAVLYRNNVLSNNIERYFSQANIPYRIYKGRDFFSRAEIRDMFAYLWVVQNPADDLRLKRIINVPARKIGAKSIETAEQEAAAQGISLFEVIENASKYPSLSRGAAAMERFGRMIQSFRQEAEFLDLSELYEEILEKSGYRDALMEKSDEDSRSRLDNIMELKSNIAAFMQKNEEATLASFLEEMALYTDADEEESEDDDDKVLMMTMHSAKGLEFPIVFVVGMEDGLFPSFRSEGNPEDMEEERRLCYVAITRAKNQLYLTCAERRMMYGQTIYSKLSRFANEIPVELMDSNVSSRSEQQRFSEYDELYRRPPVRASVSEAYRSALTSSQRAKSSAAPCSFKPGDQVFHIKFGDGMITSIKPMGGDYLLEIAFEKVGTKRLMSKIASAAMRKK